MRKHFLGLIVACLGLMILVACSYSTAGVYEVSKGKVALPQGETLMMKDGSGKSSTMWQVTYDGIQTVKFHTDAWFTSDKIITVERGAEITVDFGWMHDSLVLTTDGEVVYVSFPTGMFSDWDYKPPK